MSVPDAKALSPAPEEEAPDRAILIRPAPDIPREPLIHLEGEGIACLWAIECDVLEWLSFLTSNRRSPPLWTVGPYDPDRDCALAGDAMGN